jgi:membrane protein
MMLHILSRPIAAVKSFVWDDDLRNLTGLHRVVVFVLRVVHMLLRELLGGQLNLRAMSLVYTTLLSLVPLLAVSFSVLKGFGYHQQLERYLFDIMLEPLGPSGADVATTIIGFVDNVKVGMLGSVGFAMLIYTVIALAQKIESAFNFVWQIEHLRPMAQRFSNYLSVITIGPVLIFSAVGFTAAILDTELLQRLSAIGMFGTLFYWLSQLVPYVLVCLAFTFIYIVMPNTRVHFRAALVGGVLAGALWKVTGWGFAAFIASSAKYAAIYSSFAILILLLIWMYLSWLILLVGAQIAYFVQNPKFMTLHRVRFVLSNRLREQLALQLMYLIGYHHLHGLPPWRAEQLIDHLGLPDEPVCRLLRVLVGTGYLVELRNEEVTVYLPRYDLETIRLADLLDAVRRAGESRFLSVEQLATDEAVTGVMAIVGESLHDGLQERTLRDLAGPANAELESSVAAGDADYSSRPSAE